MWNELDRTFTPVSRFAKHDGFLALYIREMGRDGEAQVKSDVQELVQTSSLITLTTWQTSGLITFLITKA